MMLQNAEVEVAVQNPDTPPQARILIVEDDREMRKMLAQALRNQGYDVLECSDGWELIRKVGMLYLPEDREHIDLVVSDIRMPGINGLEVLTALHAFKPLPPLIFITAFGDDETHKTASRLGAVTVLDKPFDLDEFIEQVRLIIQLARRVDPLIDDDDAE